jgi:cell division protein FtsI/penicillin-binding protein 2
MDAVRKGLFGKTGTSPSIVTGADGVRRELATVWFTGYLEPGSLPGQRHRLAVAAFISHSKASGGEHAAPVVASVLESMAALNPEQKGK